MQQRLAGSALDQTRPRPISPNITRPARQSRPLCSTKKKRQSRPYLNFHTAAAAAAAVRLASSPARSTPTPPPAYDIWCPPLRSGPMAETQPRSPPPSWSAIPLDLASLVLRLLPAYADRARFAAVCPQWRDVAQQFLRLHPPLPLLALPDGTFYSLPYAKPFRFPGFGFAGYQGVCGSWLVFPRDDECFLHDPFARATVRLPPLSRVRLRPSNAVQKWTKWEDGERSPDPYTTWMHIEDMEGKLRMSKIILCSPNLVAALVGVGRPCHLPICHPGGPSQILMCQPGASSWSVRAYDKCRLYEDMAFYQGKLYAIANDENLFVVNISQDQCTGDPQVSRVGQVIKGDPWQTVASEDDNTPGKKLYLVESRGKLLMVCRKIWVPELEDGDFSFGNEFEVFEADFEHSRWVKVTTVGDDQVLFLGRRCSRAVSVSQYGLPGDRIFFLDDDEVNRVKYGYDENTFCSAYNMRDGKVSSPHPMISWKRCDEMCLAAWLFPQD
ncbi:uncharacterized protein [Triticum aestivum]|uniref:uncharacterized protein n=1 Tax=Triticum aestivum TaxID=4565 RepID=UPI001D00611D|nr:uncharacterized protein LOC123079262 [Triticum aestivum]